MTKTEHIDYWINTAEHDLLTAESMYATGHYDWCLFISHLVLEKILKAHYVKDNEDFPPKIHDLVKLTSKIKITFTNIQLKFLEMVNDFNIEARYPDEKLKFYKNCTKDFTEENFNQIKELYQWLKLDLK